jgi:hypothetical protein
MAKKRAYFCFDFDEDQGLKHHMVGQIKLPEKLGGGSRGPDQP